MPDTLVAVGMAKAKPNPLRAVDKAALPLPNYDYEHEHRARIARRDWAETHVTADRRRPFAFVRGGQ